MDKVRKKHKVEQNTEEWLKLRLTRFTSSQIYRLMTNPKHGGQKKHYNLSTSAFSYCEEKLAEYFYEDEVSTFEGNKATNWGHEMEVKARLAFEIIKNNETEDGDFWTFGVNGASPDWFYNNDTIVECKCFYSKVKYLQFVRAVKDNKTLKSFSKPYFYQTQHQMYVTGMEKSILFGFDPRLINHPNKKRRIRFYHEIEIQPDQELFDEFDKRINRADEVVHDMLKTILG